MDIFWHRFFIDFSFLSNEDKINLIKENNITNTTQESEVKNHTHSYTSRTKIKSTCTANGEKEYNLSPRDAKILVKEKALSDYFEVTVDYMRNALEFYRSKYGYEEFVWN